MKTSLGIWALGLDGDALRPGRLPAAVGRRDDRASASAGPSTASGDLIDGYEFHYPQELNAENLDEVLRGARRARRVLHGDGPPPRSAVREGRARVARPGHARRGREANARRRRLLGRARRPLHHLAGDRGLQLPVPDAVPGELGVARRRDRPGRPALRGPRDLALPRAQELRAGDEDPHAQHRDDAARDPHAPRAGPRQRQGQHGLAAPAHERREPGRVRRAARRRGPARAPARELGLGHVRRRQHGRRDGVHGDARARGRAAPRRLRRQRRAPRLRPVPVHRGRDRGGSAQRAPVAVHRLRRREDRRCRAARGADARRTRCAPTSSCTRRSAPR